MEIKPVRNTRKYPHILLRKKKNLKNTWLMEIRGVHCHVQPKHAHACIASYGFREKKKLNWPGRLDHWFSNLTFQFKPVFYNV